MNLKYLIGGVVVIAFLAWGASSFLETAVRYVSISEAKASPNQVQVMGSIDKASVQYDTTANCLHFLIHEMPADSTQVSSSEALPIVYYGVVPGNFDQAKSVVVRGKYQGNEFHADKMLVKCPSKYQGVGGEGYQDMQKHEDAMKGVTSGT